MVKGRIQICQAVVKNNLLQTWGYDVLMFEVWGLGNNNDFTDRWKLSVSSYIHTWTEDELWAGHHTAAHFLRETAHHGQGKVATHGLTKHSHLPSVQKHRDTTLQQCHDTFIAHLGMYVMHGENIWYINIKRLITWRFRKCRKDKLKGTQRP